MNSSQTIVALRYAKEKYNKDELTFRELFNIRFEIPKEKFNHNEATQADDVYAGNLFQEVMKRKHPKVKRRKNKDNLFVYSLV